MDKLNGGEAARAAPGEDLAMSDDRSGRQEPDETRAFSPFEDDEAAAGPFGDPAAPDRITRSSDPGAAAGGAAWASDRTEQMPRTPGDPAVDRTQAIPPRDDATRVTPPDRTAMLPPIDAPDAGRAEAAARAAAGATAPDWANRSEPAWAGRAEVRQPQPGAGGDFTRTDWAPVEPEPRRVWWSPILIGVLGLLLVALLGVGIWLIVQSVGDDEEAVPTVTTSAPPTPVTSALTTAPTSAAPTTTPPTTPPAEPEEVAVPALKGLSSAEARQALDRVGLTYRLIFRPADAEPGTVIDSDPPEGREVPADTEITLVIAAPRSSAPTPSASATEGGADEPDE
jgi:hypothetical protein